MQCAHTSASLFGRVIQEYSFPFEDLQLTDCKAINELVNITLVGANAPLIFAGEAPSSDEKMCLDCLHENAVSFHNSFDPVAHHSHKFPLLFIAASTLYCCPSQPQFAVHNSPSLLFITACFRCGVPTTGFRIIGIGV